MAKAKLTKKQLAQIQGAVAHFELNKGKFDAFAQGLIAQFQNHEPVSRYIHFIKYRIKDPQHLLLKLQRKVLKAKQSGETLVIDKKNVFQQITDLAGIRIIHLHTDQMKYIHKEILEIITEQQLTLVEPPTANCWDVEYENIYSEFGINVRKRDTMYSTVHYLIKANQRTEITCEIQVRTLMDEVWGEVSHSIDYPEPTTSASCREQLKVLARLTSGCTRLVDSIFFTNDEDKQN